MVIKELRKKAGFSQAELAKKMNVSGQAISMWESGKRFPHTSRVPELAKALGCTIDDLYQDTGQKGT